MNRRPAAITSHAAVSTNQECAESGLGTQHVPDAHEGPAPSVRRGDLSSSGLGQPDRLVVGMNDDSQQPKPIDAGAEAFGDSGRPVKLSIGGGIEVFRTQRGEIMIIQDVPGEGVSSVTVPQGRALPLAFAIVAVANVGA